MSDATMDFDVEWCCWAQDGWENACEGSVRAARHTARHTAHSDFARTSGEPWPNVRVWKRYVRPLDRQERYEWWVESCTNDGWDGNPETPPDEWEPGDLEDEPTWQFVHRSHPAAIPVWICGFKGDDPPTDPLEPSDV